MTGADRIATERDLLDRGFIYDFETGVYKNRNIAPAVAITISLQKPLTVMQVDDIINRGKTYLLRFRNDIPEKKRIKLIKKWGQE